MSCCTGRYYSGRWRHSDWCRARDENGHKLAMQPKEDSQPARYPDVDQERDERALSGRLEGCAECREVYPALCDRHANIADFDDGRGALG